MCRASVDLPSPPRPWRTKTRWPARMAPAQAVQLAAAADEPGLEHAPGAGVDEGAARGRARPGVASRRRGACSAGGRARGGRGRAGTRRTGGSPGRSPAGASAARGRPRGRHRRAAGPAPRGPGGRRSGWSGPRRSRRRAPPRPRSRARRGSGRGSRRPGRPPRGAAARPGSPRRAGPSRARRGRGRCRGSWPGRRTAATGRRAAPAAGDPGALDRDGVVRRPSSSSNRSRPGPPWPEKWMPVGRASRTVATRSSSVPSSVGVSGHWSVRARVMR